MKDRSRPTPPTEKDRGRTARGKAWLTAGTVAAYAAVSITRAMPARAQDIHAVPANSRVMVEHHVCAATRVAGSPCGDSHG